MNKTRRIDPIFKQKFGISTPIEYLADVEVDKKIEQKFKRAWKRFMKDPDPIISETRGERLDAFYRQLEKDGCDDRYCKRVSIRFINPVVGYGVFAKEDIPPYSTLHHYTGTLMHDDDVNPDHDSTFAFSDFKNYSIDALNSGTWTRFMNHSPDGHSSTNAIPWEYYHEDGPRIVFTSGEFGVKKGKQILYSYGDEYWEEKGEPVKFK